MILYCAEIYQITRMTGELKVLLLLGKIVFIFVSNIIISLKSQNFNNGKTYTVNSYLFSFCFNKLV